MAQGSRRASCLVEQQQALLVVLTADVWLTNAVAMVGRSASGTHVEAEVAIAEGAHAPRLDDRLQADAVEGDAIGGIPGGVHGGDRPCDPLRPSMFPRHHAVPYIVARAADSLGGPPQALRQHVALHLAVLVLHRIATRSCGAQGGVVGLLEPLCKGHVHHRAYHPLVYPCGGAEETLDLLAERVAVRDEDDIGRAHIVLF
eukprot:CAMPEP_0174764178 /NCGR_PEP_ID=MMETSP1094-20130205/110650_1 /TAXON_ID=156173 /ORGANISM="Chrysochromulina brevifilum, Strain UTEX LB 985" /LENGTH=200 /DNA_ID=CAMNT_0015970135 /DNA_START=236 /DNA_END=839 /DNA_ORIENTATION=-